MTAQRSRRRENFFGGPAWRKIFESSVGSSADRPQGSAACAERIKSAAPLSVPRRVKPSAHALISLLKNVCFNIPLGGASRATELKFVRPCKTPIFTLARLLGHLGCILCFLLRFLSLLAGFGASWGAPDSILEGSGKLRGGFLTSQGPMFRGFSMDLGVRGLVFRISSRYAKTYEKHRFFYDFRISHVLCTKPETI